jgi:hypothetical protein
VNFEAFVLGEAGIADVTEIWSDVVMVLLVAAEVALGGEGLGAD